MREKTEKQESERDRKHRNRQKYKFQIQRQGDSGEDGGPKGMANQVKESDNQGTRERDRHTQQRDVQKYDQTALRHSYNDTNKYTGREKESKCLWLC